MIVLTGGSWGCGEWCEFSINNEYHVQHHGLAQYFHELGHDVINISIPGGSNSQIQSGLSHLIEHSPQLHKKISHVFVFQTEWIRDWTEKNVLSLKELEMGWQDLKQYSISKFYYALSHLSQRYQVKIYLIGGCTDTLWLSNFEQEYPGLTVACQSMINLLVAGNHRIESPCFQGIGNDHSAQQIMSNIKSFCSSQDIEIFLEDCKSAESRRDLMMSRKDLFWPDGKHANRHGHRMLFDHLVKQGII